ncbi:peptidoglycan binding domain-containing protein [Streptomyces sp. APSN-46.1]|uniref:peptidoglycan binding domain-containing protein n=1 Tax=Streptomyces sp. APSN-46.1 TaxID=2929049 RepID=UPI0027E544EB|nr:peptidoglycan binding domain-containing protein [Streptomyces sp. APSN-46.1]
MTSNPSTPDTDGPKTETTLTTRIRINIPGSRPIPPVVVRKPVAAADPDADAPGAQPAPGRDPKPKRRPEPTRIEAAPEPGPAPVRAALPPASAPAGPAAAAAAQVPAQASAPGQAEGPASNWFAPRKATPPPPSAALPTRQPGASAGYPAAAGPRPGTPGGPGYDAPAAGGGPAGRAPAPGPVGPGLDGPRAGARTGVPGAPAGPGFDGPPAGGYRQNPAGPGPGAGFPPPAAGPRPGAPGAGYAQAAPAAAAGYPATPTAGGPGVGTTQDFPAYDGGPSTEAFPAYTDPAGPTGGPALGTAPVYAEETPSWPGPAAGVPGPTPVPAPGPTPGAARAPEPAAPAKAGKTAKPAKPAKKGRSKVVLLGGAVIGLLGVAYGAGLLLNHSDVPKGTTVLGVDISGSRDEAVAKLQTAFGNRAAAPLQLSVGGKQVELKPEKAGLTLDSQTTVRNAAGSDYNPVTVIGSLLGNERVADPVMPVDEEKLQVALQELAATAGTATEGTITFAPGKAVPVAGKAGTTLDVDASAEQVTKAFRDMVATGKAPVAELPVATREPVIGQEELDRAMREFATPAMSQNAVVKAGTKSIAFGPKVSLPKILSMQAVDGHLVEKYDLEALKELYGNTFDGILITRGNGEKTAVTPQDVAGALGKALRGKTAAERTVVIDTNPS